MRFYGIDYLQMQSNINDYLKYIIIFSTLFILIVVFSLYMRHRLQTKYRDLTIIAFLFLLFISGVQYADYTDSQNIHSRSSQMVNFIRLLSQEKKWVLILYSPVQYNFRMALSLKLMIFIIVST